MSSSIDEKLSDLKITNDELNSISEAFKKEEFRKLFAEYAQEISDPENRLRYENEITQLENERGMDVKFVKPAPGHVLKTTVNKSTKAFINVCQNENVGKPSAEKKVTEGVKQGLSWSIPHLFSPPREDYAKDKQRCQVYDFVVHPDTYRMSESNVRFRSMIDDMAVEGVEKMFSVELDHKNVKSLKMKYKGPLSSTVIRNKLPNFEAKEKDEDGILSQIPYPYGPESSEERATKQQQENEKKKNKQTEGEQQAKSKTTLKEPLQSVEVKDKKKEENFTEPRYEIKYQSHIEYGDFVHRQDVAVSTRPHQLLITINLPLISSAAALTLDVFAERLALESHKPARYKLDLSLPFKVNEEASCAKFDKSTHKLTLTLPVLPLEDSKVTFFCDGETNGEVEEKEKELEEKEEEELTGKDKWLVESEKESKLVEKESGAMREESCKASEIAEKVEKNIKNDHKDDEPDEKKNEDEEGSSANGGADRREVVKNGTDSGIEDNNPHIEEADGTKDGNDEEDEKDDEEDEKDDEKEKKDKDGKRARDDGAKDENKKDYGKNNNEGDGKNKDDGDDDDDFEASVESGKAVDDEGSFTVEFAREREGNVEKKEKKKKGKKKKKEDKNEEKEENEEEEEEEVGEENDSGEGIVVVHEKECPKLHGILKSRTSSESSSSSHDSADESASSSFKKSVSFSDRVDETVFRINQSVSTLHATLKNRKKKKEKREASKLKQQARRRKNSGSLSSGDELANPQLRRQQQHPPSEGNPTRDKKVLIVDTSRRDSDDEEEHTDSGGGRSSGEHTDNDVFAPSFDASKPVAIEQPRKKNKKSKKHKNQNPPLQAANITAFHTTDASGTSAQTHSSTPAQDSVSCSSLLSWKNPADHTTPSCPIQLDNDEVFSLDLN